MLSGNLELFSLADVLRFVARSGASGAVNIYRPVDGGRILLLEGEVVGAVVDDTPAADADGVVDVAMRLMDGGGGDFALELEPVEGPTRLPVEDFLTAVGRRRAEWHKIIGAVGSLDGALEVTASVPSGSAEITLTPLEWHIAVLVDGVRSLREIAREAGASEFSAATALLAMANAGLLELSGSPSVAGQDVEEDDLPVPGFEIDAASSEVDEEGADDEESDDEADVAEPVRAADEADVGDEDLDPAELLRELGDPRPGPRGRRVAPPSRGDQRIRLRTR